MKNVLEVKPPLPLAPAADHGFASESEAARRRFLTTGKRPLFLADWMDALFIHYEIDPQKLRDAIPYELDLFEGKAHVSLVAFTMRNLRPAFGGFLTALPFVPFSETRFLNVRAYVRHPRGAGIYFMTEFISSRLSAPLGPLAYGLPYHFATLDYDCDPERCRFEGRVSRRQGGLRKLSFTAHFKSQGSPNAAAPDELTRFLTEKYNAYTSHRGTLRQFSVWHEPWPLTRANLSIADDSLLDLTGDWRRHARLIGAMHSPGVRNVWMSRPHRIAAAQENQPRHRHRHAAFLELP